MNTPAESEDADPNRRSAILVIHGIGQQPRYETLLLLGRGLYNHLKRRGMPTLVRLVPPRELPKGANRGLRFQITKPDETVATVDLFEYYWGPYAQGILSVPRIIKWFLARTFPRPEQLTSFPPWKTIWDGLILLVYAGLILALFVISANAALGVSGNSQSLFTLSISSVAERLGWVTTAGASFWIMLAILAYSLWQVLFRTWGILFLLFQSPMEPLPIEDEGGKRRGPCAGSPPHRAKTLLGNLLWLLLWLFVFQMVRLRMETAGNLNHGNIALMVAAFTGFRELLNSFLVNFVGDIPVYLSRNEYSPSYPVRRKIIDTGSDLLLELLGVDKNEASPITIKVARELPDDQKEPGSERPRYDQVIVVGHSLGSVIGLDILRQTYLRIYGDNRWDKLTHFITLGSPLRKISYLTLQEEGDPDRLRLDSYTKTLGPVFRQRGSGNEVNWWNFVIPTDPVADYLNHATAYCGIPQDIYIARICEPIHSHSRYWRETTVYERLCLAVSV